MLNIDDPNNQPTTAAIWQLGFRPFFLFGALFAALAIPAWLVTLYLPEYAWVNVPPLWWHPHELIFGFAMAIIAGFLLTAVKNWTGQHTYSGWQLAIVFGCWAMARVLLFVPSSIPLEFAALFDFIFMAAVISKIFQCIVKAKQWRNIAIPIGLSFALLINGISYWALATQDYFLASNTWLAMMFMIALLISFIGGRVIPFFTSAKLNIERKNPIVWLDLLAFSSLAILVVVTLLNALNTPFAQACLLIASAATFGRMSRWQFKASLQEPMLWSLQLSYMCLPITLLVMAILTPTPFVVKNIMHFFAIGTIAGVCLSMITRVSLGHTGRDIYQGPNMTGPFIYMLFAAFSRGVMPLIQPEFMAEWHLLSGLLWTAAFGHFVFHFSKILFSYRPDGRPG
ncbi:NnrS family protein [Thalassotalea sp. LPB0316]|uniref:NnrS family protein n=1 Tax=Thalassotalea sp. LPB0316 TaxID=2769490 RepID=UPI00186826DC|nr:NnrS family protein [Thalassotalea sp. LPB0316]QOL25916.1 NnrS family protein [Thalassotalea sp. LPB0316]